MKKQKILIVDDEDGMREMLADLFRALGYQPIVACNGSEALSLLEKNKVALVISDIKMPVMDGIEMMRKVKAKYPDLAVILMTGYKPDYSWKEVMKAGASDYITKPFSIEMIEKKVRACLEQ